MNDEPSVLMRLLDKMPSAAQGRYRQGLYWLTVGVHAYLPNMIGSYIVLGHGQSGTNWLCNLLSSSLNIPVFKNWKRASPAVTPQIFHMHRFLPSPIARKRTLYLHRDGRDVVVSAYFKIMNSPWGKRRRRQFEQFIGDEMSDERVASHLPVFIEWNFSASHSSCVSWPKHVREARKRGYAMISFEDLKVDPLNAIQGAIRKITDAKADRARIVRAIEANEFSKKKTDQNGHFLRSGRSGDWRQYFTPEAAAKFCAMAGGELICLGYEGNDDWVNHIANHRRE